MITGSVDVLDRKRQNNTVSHLANHLYQVNSVMKFDILRAAEYKKSTTLQVPPLQIVSV